MVVVVVAVVGGQLNVTLLFSLLVSNRNRWPWSLVLQVRDGLASVATNYRLSFPVRREIVSLILTRTLSGVSVSPTTTAQSVHARRGLVVQNPLESPTVPSVCFFQSFYK